MAARWRGVIHPAGGEEGRLCRYSKRRAFHRKNQLAGPPGQLSCPQQPKKPRDLDCQPTWRTGCLISRVPMEPGDLDCLLVYLPVGRSLQGLNGIIYIKCLAECLAYGKNYIVRECATNDDFDQCSKFQFSLS